MSVIKITIDFVRGTKQGAHGLSDSGRYSKQHAGTHTVHTLRDYACVVPVYHPVQAVQCTTNGAFMTLHVCICCALPGLLCVLLADGGGTSSYSSGHDS